MWLCVRRLKQQGGPPDGFLNARETAQANAVDTVLGILHDDLSRIRNGVRLTTANFRYTTKGTLLRGNRACDHPPLN